MQNKGINDVALLLARVLIGALFVGGAVQKAVSPEDASGLLRDWGLPGGLVWVALVFNAGAGVALWIGLQVRVTAVLLAGYCVVTSIFHLVPNDPWQMSIFVKNFAIAGGCLALAVAGSGRLAIRPDAR